MRVILTISGSSQTAVHSKTWLEVRDHREGHMKIHVLVALVASHVEWSVRIQD